MQAFGKCHRHDDIYQICSEYEFIFSSLTLSNIEHKRKTHSLIYGFDLIKFHHFYHAILCDGSSNSIIQLFRTITHQTNEKNKRKENHTVTPIHIHIHTYEKEKADFTKIVFNQAQWGRMHSCTSKQINFIFIETCTR